MNKLIAVTIGDIEGIGIEILIKEWKKKRIKNFILVTNYNLFKNIFLQKKFLLKYLNHQSKIIKLISQEIFLIFIILKRQTIIKIA